MGGGAKNTGDKTTVVVGLEVHFLIGTSCPPSPGPICKSRQEPAPCVVRADDLSFMY